VIGVNPIPGTLGNGNSGLRVGGVEQLQDAVTHQRRFTASALLQRQAIAVHAYPAMLCAGAVFGIIGATRWAEFHGIAAPRAFAAMLLLFLPSLVGARLLFVAFHWELYRHRPRLIWQRAGGGAALYGGLIVSFLASQPLLRALAIPSLAFWDAASIALLIGMVFTRAGCLLHGCCAGRPSENFLAFRLPGARGVWRRRLPAQLFEAGLAVVVLLGSIQVASRLRFDGGLFLSALAAYAAGRWMLEPTRETVDRAGRWSLNRGISAALMALAAAVFLFLWVSRSGAAPVSG
jgi:phosphatidylglycerol:prolipoprotein diacylglycerol transferase